LQADLLFEETVSLFGAPPLAKDDPDEMRAQISGMTLFLSQYRKENYARWNATLPGGPIRPAAVMMVDSAGLALRAAMDGAGVALAGVEIAAFDVGAGRLKQPFPHWAHTGGGYFLVYPEALARDRRVRNLSRWMVEASAGERSLAQRQLEPGAD
jgi:LysR family transcriptional regulator, glycine cleavage system transcriptional activator